MQKADVQNVDVQGVDAQQVDVQELDVKTIDHRDNRLAKLECLEEVDLQNVGLQKID